jgi:hypothetical protein
MVSTTVESRAAGACGAFDEWSDIDRFVALGDPVVPASGTAPVYDERYRTYRALYEALKPAARA